VIVEVVAGSWEVNGTPGGQAFASFTVAGDAPGQTTGTGTAPVGPLQLEAPTIGIAGMAFEKGKLNLTIAIGANRAAL
jgi:hypothetical protein